MLSKQHQIVFLALSIALAGMSFSVSEAAQKTYKTGTTMVREYNLADQSLQTGRYSDAETKLMSLLQKDPNNAKVRSTLAVVQAELYKLDASEKNAQQVLAKDPNNAMAHAALGAAYRNRTASLDMEYHSRKDDLLNQSADELEKAVRLNSKSPEIHNQLGVTYRMQGRFADAQQQFATALRYDPQFAEAMVNEGIGKMDQGDLAGAKMSYQQAIKLNSKNQTAYYRMGEAYLKEGNPHKALQSLNTALSLSPGNAAVLNKMAEANQSQGNTSAAIANYQRAIQSSPAFMPSYVGLGNLYDSRGDGELSMATLRSALNVNPKYAPARDQLGRLALTVDKPDQALQYYKEALQQNPQDPEALQGMSQALMSVATKTSTESAASGSESDLADAETAVQEALRYNPNDLRLHLAALRISQLDGKPEASDAELQQIINRPAQSESDRIVQGEAYWSLGKYPEANQIFDQALANASRNPQKLLVLGDTLKANGDLEGAKKAYQMANTASPGGNNLKASRAINRIDTAQAEAQKSLRLAKSMNNPFQKRSAIDFYEETLSKDPQQPEARLALAKLYERTDQYDKAARSYEMYLALVPNMKPSDREHYEHKIAKLRERAQQPSKS